MNSPHASKRPQTARCLVIQLARLGDTLQSLMALRAAKQLYPDLEIHVVVREKFAAAAKRVPWITEVITLPTDDLIGPLLSGAKTRQEGLRDLARWTSGLIQERWDFVVNWTYSEASSYLTGLLPARVKLGYSRRRDLTFSAEDGWSHYMQAVVQGKVEQNIHLTDILTTQLLTALQIHMGEPRNDGNVAATSRDFFELQAAEVLPVSSFPKHKMIALQLGASHSAKTWDAHHWAKLASFILDRHDEYGIVLLGDPGDQERANAFLAEIHQHKESGRVLSLVGQTGFDLWASVIGRCHWLMAGDTAAVHLASVLGTPVLNVSVGPVKWSETGPYGNGHYIVSSSAYCAACAEDSKDADAHTCRKQVTPEAVYATWTYAATENFHHRQSTIESHFSQLSWTEHLKKVNVNRSKIRSGEEGGGVVYEPVSHQKLRIKDWSAQVMGHIARSWYCGWVPPMGQELSRDTMSSNLIQTLRKIEESANILGKICIEGRQTALDLSRKSSRLKSDRIMNIENRDELKKLGEKLSELDALIERTAATQEALVPFGRMSKVLMHNLRSQALSDLGKESADAYQLLHQGMTVLRDWIKHTISLAKPVAVHEAKVISLPPHRSDGKELNT